MDFLALCEHPECSKQHDKSYASGRFCSSFCSRSFSRYKVSKAKRDADADVNMSQAFTAHAESRDAASKPKKAKAKKRRRSSKWSSSRKKYPKKIKRTRLPPLTTLESKFANTYRYSHAVPASLPSTSTLVSFPIPQTEVVPGSTSQSFPSQTKKPIPLMRSKQVRFEESAELEEKRSVPMMSRFPSKSSSPTLQGTVDMLKPSDSSHYEYVNASTAPKTPPRFVTHRIGSSPRALMQENTPVYPYYRSSPTGPMSSPLTPVLRLPPRGVDKERFNMMHARKRISARTPGRRQPGTASPFVPLSSSRVDPVSLPSTPTIGAQYYTYPFSPFNPALSSKIQCSPQAYGRQSCSEMIEASPLPRIAQFDSRGSLPLFPNIVNSAHISPWRHIQAPTTSHMPTVPSTPAHPDDDSSSNHDAVKE